jgi:plasmid segregation protein ParM
MYTLCSFLPASKILGLTMNRLAENKSSGRAARAIDAGFGVMKFTRPATRAESKDAFNGVVCDHFLSVAIDAEKEQVSVDSGRKRDTVLVAYDGRSCEVGKDVKYAMVASDFGRDMTDFYYESKVYHALMCGALAYMGDEYINTLVLGLPMKHFENNKRVATLESQYTGEIDLGHGRKVTIGQTIVHPQPFGGYISLGNDLDGINKTLSEYPECGIKRLKSVEELYSLNVLIVDPGEFTLDWLLMAPGGQAQRVSSDAGRHRILREVHALLEAKIGRPMGASFMTDIDEALRHKQPILIGGRAYDLSGEEFSAAVERRSKTLCASCLEAYSEPTIASTWWPSWAAAQRKSLMRSAGPALICQSTVPKMQRAKQRVCTPICVASRRGRGRWTHATRTSNSHRKGITPRQKKGENQ